MSASYYLTVMFDNCIPRQQLGSCSVTRSLRRVWLARLIAILQYRFYTQLYVNWSYCKHTCTCNNKGPIRFNIVSYLIMSLGVSKHEILSFYCLPYLVSWCLAVSHVSKDFNVLCCFIITHCMCPMSHRVSRFNSRMSYNDSWYLVVSHGVS